MTEEVVLDVDDPPSASAEISFSLINSDTCNLNKVIFFDRESEKIRKAPVAYMSRGHIEVRKVMGMAGYAGAISTLKSN